jgi:hypothetical protein
VGSVGVGRFGWMWVFVGRAFICSRSRRNEENNQKRWRPQIVGAKWEC